MVCRPGEQGRKDQSSSLEWHNMALIQRRNKAFRNERGMSLIELMIAMVVLMVGLVGSMALVAVSVGNNGRNNQQGNSTIVSQLITEKISRVKATTSPTLMSPPVPPRLTTSWLTVVGLFSDDSPTNN